MMGNARLGDLRMKTARLVEAIHADRGSTTGLSSALPVGTRQFDVVRMVEHLVSYVSDALLSRGTGDPAGLILTVTTEQQPDGSTRYFVSGSLPFSSDQ